MSKNNHVKIKRISHGQCMLGSFASADVYQVKFHLVLVFSCGGLWAMPASALEYLRLCGCLASVEQYEAVQACPSGVLSFMGVPTVAGFGKLRSGVVGSH